MIKHPDVQFLYTSHFPQSVTGAASSVGGYPSATEVVFSDLFSNALSKDLRQYRCVAVKNISQSTVLHDVSFYFRQTSRNRDSLVRLAVERPQTDAVIGIATGGTNLSLRDDKLDNAKYAGSVIEFTSGTNAGQVVRVAAFDEGTKTLTFAGSMESMVTAGDGYIVHPSPAQWISSQKLLPKTGEGNVSAWLSPIRHQDAVSINVGGSRKHGADLLPQDVVYVWFERQLRRNARPFDNNRVVLAMRFTK